MENFEDYLAFWYPDRSRRINLVVEQKRGRRSSNCIFSIIFCLTNVETRVKAWHLSSDRPVIFGGFKPKKGQRLQCV